LNGAVQGKALDVECLQSPILNKVVQMLDKLDQWVTEIPPTEQPQRFGNISFRVWHERLQQVRNWHFYLLDKIIYLNFIIFFLQMICYRMAQKN